MTMLQTRPSSSEAFQNGSQGQQHQRNSQIPRNIYNTSVGGMAAGNYRGHTSTSPVSPYGFSSPPILPNGSNPLRQHPTAVPPPRLENRTVSAPSVPHAQQASQQSLSIPNRPRPPVVTTSSTPLSAPNSNNPRQQTIPDGNAPTIATAPPQTASRPLSTADLSLPPPQTASYATVAKSSPDRYRRNHRRAETSGPLTTTNQGQGGSAMPSGSGMATVGHLYTHPTQTSSTPSLTSYPSYRGAQTASSPIVNDYNFGAQPRLASKDDMNLQKERQASTDLAKRYRRRSISSMEAKHFAIPLSEAGPPQQQGPIKSYAAMLAGPSPQERKEVRTTPAVERPTSSHGRSGSNESSVSGRSAPKSSGAKRFELPTPAPTTAQEGTPIARNEAKVINIPARGSSEASKRLASPSPLSQPMAMSPEIPSSNHTFDAPEPLKPAAPIVAHTSTVPSGIPQSPAAQHLAALNKKDGKKEGKSSRLRRAFSFGSAAELRKASAENSAAAASNERAKLRKDRYVDEQEAQQAAEIQKQEAAGLGEGIYSGQGHFFTGSTDNLSISSTASSASVMIRKMGKGMKKGSRSLVGLFRPKSVVGVPAADSAVPEVGIAQVSMVTVEAEREKVNVNANPHDQAGGGTGFPKLERNSMDAAHMASEPKISFGERPGSSRTESSRGRRSIVGGEEERAKVLAAVKKGILKRTDSGQVSPVTRPVDMKTPDFNLPQIPHFNDSPHSSAPTTPIDEHVPRSGHRKTDSVNIEGEEYFLSLANFTSSDSKSLPGTPRSLAARNISFSPRIQFHDTWPPGEYDRRGEIATCNRLTPLLAQQIKEELNTFKMEMEVHAESKVYTHFF
ncbi:MAG: bud neck involved protein [Alectoria sarmentosa]|nr:MAG: bud neck involved protein [Alectoria sarmentosa]CAD6588295.1 MAG: bud neck involved protein [Alectoria sarmentosa]